MVKSEDLFFCISEEAKYLPVFQTQRNCDKTSRLLERKRVRCRKKTL